MALENFKIADLSISRVSEVKTLVEEIYGDHSEYEFYSETRNIEDAVGFYRGRSRNEKARELKITKYPKSKKVQINLESQDLEQYIVVRSTSSPKLYSFLEYFRNGYRGYQWNNKFDRFKNLYLIYEALETQKEYKFTAVRHAISHPHKSPRVQNEIRRIFNEDDIDLKKRRHVLLFRELHEELLKATESLLLTYIYRQIETKDPVYIGQFTII